MYPAANKKQIPFGNDKQRGTGKGKNKSKGNSRILRFATE